MTALETGTTTRVWRGGAPWTRSAVDATPRALADPLSPRRGRADAADDGAAPALPRALADAARRPVLERRCTACRAGSATIRSTSCVLHYSVLCMRWEAPFERWRSSLDWIRGQRRRAAGDAAGRVRLRPHAGRVAGEPGPRLRVLGARRAPLAARSIPGRARGRGWSARTPASSTTARPAPWSTLPRPHAERTLDIVYRARNLPFHVGHHGQLKHRIAEVVDPAARAHGLRTDISTRIADTKYGDAWFEFLASGRCVIGTESGSSALDPYGELRRFEAALACRAPRRDLRGVLGAAAARLGRLRLHRHQPAAVRGRADEDRAAARGGRVRRHPGGRSPLRAAAPRTSRTSTRRWSGSPTRPRRRPWPSAPGRT